MILWEGVFPRFIEGEESFDLLPALLHTLADHEVEVQFVLRSQVVEVDFLAPVFSSLFEILLGFSLTVPLH